MGRYRGKTRRLDPVDRRPSIDDAVAQLVDAAGGHVLDGFISWPTVDEHIAMCTNDVLTELALRDPSTARDVATNLHFLRVSRAGT